jgi:hypothetical protein
MCIGVDVANAPAICASAGTAGAEPSRTGPAAAADEEMDSVAPRAHDERSAPTLDSRPIPLPEPTVSL